MSELHPNAIGFSWFTGQSCICIAIWYNEDSEEVEARINTCTGTNEEQDVNNTLYYGSFFPLEEAVLVVEKCGGWVKPEKDKWKPKAESESIFKMKLSFKNQATRKKLGSFKEVVVINNDSSGTTSAKTAFNSDALLL